MEITDGIKSLYIGSSINVSSILLRSIFEVYLGIKYIFQEESEIKRRALSYDVENLYRKITYYEKMDVNNEEYAEFREIVGEGVAENFDSEDIQKRINNLKSIFDKYPEYKEIKEERERTISHNIRRYRNKAPRWYELFDGPKSIYQLSKTLNVEKYYITLYEYYPIRVMVAML